MMIFFFKQKTAYEMRISDWSSDVCSSDLSVLLGLCPVADAAKVQRHLASLGMHTGLDAVPTIAWDPDRLIGHMAKDKKVQGGRMTFVLVRGIGKALDRKSTRLNSSH